MPRRAFSLVEVVISMLVVSVLLVAAMRAVGASRTGQLVVADRTAAGLLAQDLLSEIVMLPYEDPENATNTIGPETGETAGPDRSLFDDIDDYHGWESTPATERDGTAIASAADLTRTVSVSYARASDLRPALLSGTGIKRIEVVVKSGDRELARLFSFRCSATRSSFEAEEVTAIERVR